MREVHLGQNAGAAPTREGVLVIDETGDRKWGDRTAHVGRQYLGSVGKVDNSLLSRYLRARGRKKRTPLKARPGLLTWPRHCEK